MVNFPFSPSTFNPDPYHSAHKKSIENGPEWYVYYKFLDTRPTLLYKHWK